MKIMKIIQVLGITILSIILCNSIITNSPITEIINISIQIILLSVLDILIRIYKLIPKN